MNSFKTFVDRCLADNGISKSQLVTRLGFKNISKGIRRVDAYIDNLEGSKEVAYGLQEALNVPAEDFRDVLHIRHLEIESAKEAAFKPSIRVVYKQRQAPLFVLALCPDMINIQVPSGLSQYSITEEIAVVCDLYREHQLRWGDAWCAGIGFRYYRKYGECWEFDADGNFVNSSRNAVILNDPSLTVNGRNVNGVLLNSGIHRERI